MAPVSHQEMVLAGFQRKPFGNRVSSPDIITDCFHRCCNKLKIIRRHCTLALYNNCTEQLRHHLLLLYPLRAFCGGASVALFSLQSSNCSVGLVFFYLASDLAMIFFPGGVKLHYRALCVNTSLGVYWETGACSTLKAVQLYIAAFHCL